MVWSCGMFFKESATTEIYTLSLHDALPISTATTSRAPARRCTSAAAPRRPWSPARVRSEEHTSELQSRQYLVCRLLLEKKKTDRTFPVKVIEFVTGEQMDRCSGMPTGTF